MADGMETVDPVAAYFMYSVRFDTSLTLSAFTILYYDYAMTVLSEIQYYWSPPKLSTSFVLFAVNRYIGLLGPIPVFFEYFFLTTESYSLALYHQAFAMMSQGIVAILLILRTYALYECNKRILALLVGMHFGGSIHCLSAVLTSKSPLTTDIQLDFHYPRCNLSLTDDQGVHLALAWSAMLWFDTIIFLLTFFKAIQMRREMSGGLLEILFRDGTIYYGILVAVNMVNIITFLKTPPDTPMKGMATTMTNVLSVTLTSRLMLNLRDPSLQRGRHIGAGTSRYDGWSTGQFSSRMMSFRNPNADTESMTLDEMGDSDVRLDTEAGTYTPRSATHAIAKQRLFRTRSHAMSVRLTDILVVASAAILYYDYSLTLGAEVDRFWRVGRCSFVNILFVLNRYLALLGAIPVCFEFFGDLPRETFHQYYTIVSQTIVVIVLSIRTYALYTGNVRVTRGLVALNLVMVVVVVIMITLGMLAQSTATSDPDTMHPALPTCASSLSVTHAQGFLWAEIWIVVLVFDLTILALTVAKALTMRESVRYGLFRVLFRDAQEPYTLRTVNVVTFLIPRRPDPRQLSRNSDYLHKRVWPFLRNSSITDLNSPSSSSASMSVTLVSRIILNLRDAAVHGRIQRLTPRSFALSSMYIHAGATRESLGWSDTQTMRTLSFHALPHAESDQEEEVLSSTQHDSPHIRESLDVRMMTAVI
ncbi:hypothetical protein ONZ51_g10958 [Trametes cubensis]|uniref:DUF6533 domain-containing protein n=1 Tax=Trametes cubensis TaxID=1111947 RepID=A0AAD7X5U3_9APHY|nr:hypothetical protein ONZ51_g10958 [Trametes cubensis]